MNTRFFRITTAAMTALLFLYGAAFVSAWEGAATIAPGGDLPGGGYSIATNSFPVNTIVDVVNLENDRIVRVNVISGLSTTGPMATLSRDAAEAIGLRGNSSCRIRMSQSSHELAASRLRLGPVVEPSTAGTPAPAAVAVSPDVETATETSAEISAAPKPDVTPAAEPAIAASTEDNAATDALEIASSAEETPSVAIAPVEETPVTENFTGILSLSPSEERIPAPTNRQISSEDLAPPIGRADYIAPADFSPFPAPLISRLERGKYYVQVGAYTRPDNVEDEINRIGTSYPLAIQNIGTDSNPMFRVLLGPLDQSESTVLLQNFKNRGYQDAFVWHN